MAETVYRSGLTSKAMALAILPLFVAVYLVWVGVADMNRFSSKDPMRFLLVYGPILLGVVVLGATAFVAMRNLRHQTTVSGAGVHFHEGGREVFHAGWATFTHVSRGQGLVRVLVMSDGRRFGRVFDLFTPKFDDLLQNLARHEKAAANRVRHKLG